MKSQGTDDDAVALEFAAVLVGVDADEPVCVEHDVVAVREIRAVLVIQKGRTRLAACAIV